jgi:hypothetical protein
MNDNMSRRDKIDDLIDEWHDMYPDDDAVVSLHDFLGLTWEEYAIFTEWNVLPEETIDYDKFSELRNRLARLSKQLVRCSDELNSHKEVVKHIRNGIALSKTHFYGDELHPMILEDILKDNELEKE